MWYRDVRWSSGERLFLRKRFFNFLNNFKNDVIYVAILGYNSTTEMSDGVRAKDCFQFGGGFLIF